MELVHTALNKSKGVIHLLVTTMCNRDCKYCCNKQYDLNTVPYVTDKELKKAHTICITGGEPFSYTMPNQIATYYKGKYSNIKNVYVYTNAYELSIYLLLHKSTQDLLNIDGLTVSIKNGLDLRAYNALIKDDERIMNMKSNILYVFDDEFIPEDMGNFKLIKREWQEDFKPASDSIFRKV